MGGTLELLRRHGLAVLLVAATLWIFVGSTLPALEERARLRRLGEQVETARALRAGLVAEHEQLLQGAEDDPQIRARLQDGLLRSPALAGPRIVVPPPPVEAPAEGASTEVAPEEG